MKQLLTTLILTVFSIYAFGQIKTPEVEIRAAATTWLNEINGPTTLSGSFDVSEIPGSFFMVSPQITSNGGQNYERGLRVLMTDAYGIPAGVTDTGYRIGIDISAHAKEASFEGTLQSLQGMRIQFGTNSDSPTGTVNEVRGLNLQGLTSSNAVIGNAYAIYQSGATFKNYFQGRIGIGFSDPEAPLHVVAGNHINYNWTPSTGTAAILESSNTDRAFLSMIATNYTDIMFGDVESQTSGRIRYLHDNDQMDLWTNGIRRVTIDNVGKLGIGTEIPEGTLHVKSSSSDVTGGTAHSNFDNLIIEENGANIGMTLLARNNNNAGIAFADNDRQNSGLINYIHNDDDMTFNTDGSEKIRITKEGNIGIGTNSPQTKLMVVDDNLDLTGMQGLLIGGGTSGMGNYTPAVGFSNTNNTMDAAIAGVQGHSDPNGMGLAFLVHSSAGGSNPKMEAMRITRTGYVGIGTDVPSGNLEVAHTGASELVVSGNGSGYSNAGLVLKANWTTANKRATGVYMHDKLGENEWYAGRPYSNSDKYVIYRNPSAPVHIKESSARNTTSNPTGVEAHFTLLGNGNLGLGSVSPSERLHVSGDVLAVNYKNSSDRRWKKDISMISDAQQTLNGIRPVSYQWRVDEFPEKDFDNEIHYGVIAQELEKVLPELVSTDNEGYKSVDYLGMIGLLIKGFQERGEEIERLNAELSAKTSSNKDELATLESRLARLEALLGEEGQESKGSSTSEK